jgi:hypothetical protein
LITGGFTWISINGEFMWISDFQAHPLTPLVNVICKWDLPRFWLKKKRSEGPIIGAGCHRDSLKTWLKQIFWKSGHF